MNDEPKTGSGRNKVRRRRNNLSNRRDSSGSGNVSQNPGAKNHDWYDKTHLVVLTLTFVTAVLAAIFTGWMAYRTDGLATDSNKQLIASTRAWIVPTGAQFDGPITVGSDLRLKIIFENTGREPAQNFFDAYGGNYEFTIPYDAKGMPFISYGNVPWPKNNMCNLTPPKEGGRTIYPAGKYTDNFYIFGLGPTFLPQSFADKKTGVIFFGCFIYEHQGEVHHSPYCFYSSPSRELSAQNSEFVFCLCGDPRAD
jgi:hypothetical protein